MTPSRLLYVVTVLTIVLSSSSAQDYTSRDACNEEAIFFTGGSLQIPIRNDEGTLLDEAAVTVELTWEVVDPFNLDQANPGLVVAAFSDVSDVASPNALTPPLNGAQFSFLQSKGIGDDIKFSVTYTKTGELSPSTASLTIVDPEWSSANDSEAITSEELDVVSNLYVLVGTWTNGLDATEPLPMALKEMKVTVITSISEIFTFNGEYTSTSIPPDVENSDIIENALVVGQVQYCQPGSLFLDIVTASWPFIAIGVVVLAGIHLLNRSKNATPSEAGSSKQEPSALLGNDEAKKAGTGSKGRRGSSTGSRSRRKRSRSKGSKAGKSRVGDAEKQQQQPEMDSLDAQSMAMSDASSVLTRQQMS